MEDFSMFKRVAILIATLLPAIILLAAEPVPAPAAAAKVEVTDIWVVFKTHFDIGFTETVPTVLAKYRGEMMDNALGLIEANRELPASQRFAWTIPGWPLSHVLGPQQQPARRERILQAVKEGAIVPHALPFTMHVESLDYEDLVRGLGFASRISREAGRPLPIGAKMTDVPCHSWVLPTLLRHAGVRFLQLGCNIACSWPQVPELFWWEGPDGSRLLVHYTTDYGSKIIPPAGWPCKNYLAIIMAGDNHGPPTATEVDALRQEAAAKLPGIKLHFGTFDDFVLAIEAEKPMLPVLRTDMPDTWIHGIGSMPVETALARQTRPLIPEVETLGTQLRAWQIAAPSPTATVAAAYEQSLLYGEHTWGLFSYQFKFRYNAEWQKALADGTYARLLGSFDDHRNYINNGAKLIEPGLDKQLAALACAVKVDGPRIVVWNPLPWPRSGQVALSMPGTRFSGVKDLADGQLIPASPAGDDFSFFAVDIPANGYRTYVPVAGVPAPRLAEPKPGTLENRRFRLVLDLKRGGIASLIDKQSGRELVDQDSPYALGQFLHERFDDAHVKAFGAAYNRPGLSWSATDFGKPFLPGADQLQYAKLVPADWTASPIRHSVVSDQITLTAGDTQGLAKAISLTLTLWHSQPAIDVAWQIDGKVANPIPEGGWLCFPLAVKQPKFTLGRLGGPVNPATEIIAGANRHLGAVTTGVLITGADGQGAALCPLDSPLVSLGRPGLWSYSATYVPTTPTVFVNLYNNMWNTNFPLWIDGSWSSRVRLWPAGNDIASNLTIPAWEARKPLQATGATGPGGSQPITQTGLELSRPGILVTAFGTDPDGNPGTLLRLWNQTQTGGELTITLPQGLKAKQATPISLRGEKTGKPIKIKKGKFTIELPGYAPASFVLE
jgi:hypothetical protein